MALELKIGISSTIDEIRIKDLTGIYDLTTNPTGYGAPNEVTSDFNTATLIVTLPDGTIVTLDPFGTFPTSDITTIYTITPLMLNLTSFEPGVYKFDYSIDFISGDLSTLYFSVSKKYFNASPLKCCLSKRMKRMNFSCSTDEQICEVALFKAKLEAAIAAACSGNYEETIIISDYLWDKCGCCC